MFVRSRPRSDGGDTRGLIGTKPVEDSAECVNLMKGNIHKDASCYLTRIQQDDLKDKNKM